MNIIQRLKALLRHPAKRLADDKRELGRICQAHGLSRKKSREITVAFFDRPRAS